MPALVLTMTVRHLRHICFIELLMLLFSESDVMSSELREECLSPNLNTSSGMYAYKYDIKGTQKTTAMFLIDVTHHFIFIMFSKNIYLDDLLLNVY